MEGLDLAKGPKEFLHLLILEVVREKGLGQAMRDFSVDAEAKRRVQEAKERGEARAAGWGAWRCTMGDAPTGERYCVQMCEMQDGKMVIWGRRRTRRRGRT